MPASVCDRVVHQVTKVTSGKLHLHETMLVLTTKTESRSQIFLNM